VHNRVRPVNLFERVTALLEGHQVPHALIGAAALAAAGVARSTFDIDLLTSDPAVLKDTFWSSLGGPGISVDIRRGDHEDPLAGVVRIEAPSDRPVDVIVGKHAWQARMIARANRPSGGPPIVTPADLILLKLYAGGSQDLWDVRELLATPSGETIASQVEEALPGLPSELQTRWATVR
jgi:hypothetical protein